MTLTMAEVEAEFWGLEREQPTRTRLRRVLALVLQRCLETSVDDVLFSLVNDVRKTEDPVGLIHKLQTEIGELRTEIAMLKK